MSKSSISFFPFYFHIIPAIAALPPPSSDFCSNSQSQQRNPYHLQKKEDRFNIVYNSDGEPGPFCDMEDLEDTQYFDEYALPDVPPPNSGKTISDYDGNESFAEGVDKSNNDSSHTVNVDIPLYQVQKMNVNHLKYKLSKRENLYVVQKHSQ